MLAMTYGAAALLGIIEGLTEYLPVSSTGHLLVAQRALGLGADDGASRDAAEAFAICIQAGAILAVLGLYRARAAAMCRGLLGHDPAGLRLFLCLVAGLLPAVVIGLLFEKKIKRWLFGGGELGLWPIVGAWIVGGIAILIIERWRRRPATHADQDANDDTGLELEQMNWKQGFVIGLVQCLAMWPGVSRSLTTILGGVTCGLRTSAAVEFSFLLGVLTLGGATAKDGLEHGSLMLEVYGAGPLLVGTLTATLAAVVAMKWMIQYLKRHGLEIFGVYRIVLGIAVAAWLLTGR